MNNLQLKQTTLTQEAEMVTADATYKVTYSIKEGEIERVIVRVFTKQIVNATTPAGEPIQDEKTVEAGQMIYENGTFRIPAFPYSLNIPVYVNAFMDILRQISAPATNEEII